MKSLLRTAALAGALFAASGAQAATVFSDRAAFLAVAGDVVTDGFDTVPFGVSQSYAAYDGAGFILQAANKVHLMDQAFNAWSNWGSGDIGASVGGAPLVITFDAPVFAFGVDLMSFPFGRKVQVASGAWSGEVSTVAFPNRAFLGFTSDQGFTSVTLRAPQGQLLFDNLSFSGGVSPVPEPVTWAMMILGLGGVGAALRRSRALVLARA